VHAKTKRTGTFPFSNEGAEGVLVFPAVERKAKKLDWPEHKRKAGSIGEGSLVITVEPGPAESAEQLLVALLGTFIFLYGQLI
jgi:hypothetical protein